jgi:UDP-N-acetylmuramoylalanine--D-glutamate ligase
MDLNGARVLLLGFGEEGRASLRYLQARSPGSISIADSATNIVLSSSEQAAIEHTHLGPQWLDAVEHYDVVIRSPGVPRRLLDERLQGNSKVQITSGTDLFLAVHAHKSIGVTATKGKSTTTSLLHALLTASGIKAELGGNIGIPAITLLDSDAELFVLELSSYQLEDCSSSPHGALFLNLYPEHLDHHGDFTRYAKAKARITQFQTSEDFLVVPQHQTAVLQSTSTSRAQRLFSADRDGTSWIEAGHYHLRMSTGSVLKLCKINETRLKGPGNQQNILAALAAVSRYEINPDSIARALTSFAPLPHRLEEVSTINGVAYINDSISTVPEAAINALETYGDAVSTIILGGYDRGIEFEALAKYLVGTQVRTIILFPPSGARIEHALRVASEVAPHRFALFTVDSMRDAVRIAADNTPEHAVCLLSPASPSFPLFKNFKERGDAFRREVLMLRPQESNGPA